MITISLNQIKAKDPCEDGWETILKARGDDADYNEQFPLSFALDSNGLDDVLWSLQCLPEHDNLWRKYAVWCARQVEHLMEDQRSKDALDVAWRHSEGQATDDGLLAARDAARDAAWSAAWSAAQAGMNVYPAWSAARAAASGAASAAYDAARDAAHAAVIDAARAAGRAAAWTAARATAGEAAAWSALAAARDAQTNKLRKILDAGEWV